MSLPRISNQSWNTSPITGAYERSFADMHHLYKLTLKHLTSSSPLHLGHRAVSWRPADSSQRSFFPALPFVLHPSILGDLLAFSFHTMRTKHFLSHIITKDLVYSPKTRKKMTLNPSTGKSRMGGLVHLD